MATKKDTSKMPKTKRNLGATDAGQAQRTGGLRAAGNFLSASSVKPSNFRNSGDAINLKNRVAKERQTKLKTDVTKKNSKGSLAKKK